MSRVIAYGSDTATGGALWAYSDDGGVTWTPFVPTLPPKLLNGTEVPLGWVVPLSPAAGTRVYGTLAFNYSFASSPDEAPYLWSSVAGATWPIAISALSPLPAAWAGRTVRIASGRPFQRSNTSALLSLRINPTSGAPPAAATLAARLYRFDAPGGLTLIAANPFESAADLTPDTWGPAAEFADGTLLIGAAGNNPGFTTGVARSTDAGATWAFVYTAAFPADQTPIHVINATTALFIKYIAATGYRIHQTTDTGATWAVLTTIAATPASENVGDFLDLGAGVYLFAGSSADWMLTIWRSTDAGATWTTMLDTAVNVAGSSNILETADGGLLILADGRSFRSVDDGVTWVEQGATFDPTALTPVPTIVFRVADAAAGTVGATDLSGARRGGGCGSALTVTPCPEEC